MRGLFDQLLKSKGLPPSPEEFEEAVWSGCEGVKSELEPDVKARSRRAHPSFVREAHFGVLLRERLHGVAEVFSNEELDLEGKTDFLVQSLTAPIEIRIHTHTDTQRAHRFADMEKKTPTETTSVKVRDGEADAPTVVDLKLLIKRGDGQELENGLWLYDAGHADEVFSVLHEIHVMEGFDF